MEKQKITYQFADIGHWLARCNHQTNVVELNAREYASLSPMMRDYIWVHECVHLLGGIGSETECNAISDGIFVSRSRNDADRKRRIAFVEAANDQSFTRVTAPRPDESKMLLAVLVILCVYVFFNLKTIKL